MLDRHLLPAKYEEWFIRDVNTARVAATTAIEGHEVPEETVHSLINRGKSPTNDDEAANVNAAVAYEFVDHLSEEPQMDIPLNEFVIRELNRLFMKGAPALHTPGAYRKGQNTAGNAYTTPNAGDVPALMRDLSNWMSVGHEIHPVVKAALTHIQFVAIHPFWDGNGRTARALLTLMLQRQKPIKYLSIEKVFQGDRDGYFTAIERTLGPKWPETYDATPWIEYVVGKVFTGIEEVVNRFASIQQILDELKSTLFAAGLKERQVDGLWFAGNTGWITRADYIEITGVSGQTASRDLRSLVQLGILSPHGKTRDRVYEYIPKKLDEGEHDPSQPRLIED